MNDMAWRLRRHGQTAPTLVRSMSSHPIPAPATPRPAGDRWAVDRHWDLLLGCVAVHIAFSVGRLHELFPVFWPLKPALVSSLLAVGLYLMQQHGPRRIYWLRAATTTYVLLLLLWAALSVPGALHQGVAFRMVTDGFIKTVLMYLVIIGSGRGFRDVEQLAFAYLAAATVFAATVLARFQVSDSSWRLGHLYFTYDANDFATFAVSAIPLALYFTLAERRLSRRLLGASGIATLVVAFVWSGSRGGFLAMLAMAAFLLFRYTMLRARWRILGTAVIAAIFVTTASDRYWTQMGTILKPSEDYNLTVENGRERIWRRGAGYMLSHPLFGVGADNFGVAEGTISYLARLQERGIGVRWNAPHNSFLQAGAELGIPGLFFLLAVVGTAFRSLGRVERLGVVSSRHQRGPPALAQSLKTSLVGFVVGAFFLSLAYSEMLYALVALAVALGKVMSFDEHVARGSSWYGTNAAQPRYLRSIGDPRP